MRTRVLEGTLLALAVALGLPGAASGAGMYFGDRGVRPLSRAGAFVAGADDLGALWYNPAGLVDAGSGLLVDAAWLGFSSEFTRRVSLDDSSGARRVVELPGVEGSVPLLPYPTLVGAWAWGEDRQWVAAAGLMAPQTPLVTYPLEVDGVPAPSRFSLVSIADSLLAIPGLAVAWRPSDFLQVGAGVQVLAGSFVATTVFGTSPPDRLLSAPEDPAYDALAELRAPGLLAPSASFGLTVRPKPWLRVGLSGQLPFVVDTAATLRVRLPQAAVFDEARQEGERARLKLTLPAILRLGVEAHPVDGLRVELGYAREFWSSHQDIELLPEDIHIHGVTGLPSPLRLAPMAIPRRFQDSSSVRLGGEYALRVWGLGMQARAGVSYEQSAIPLAYLSPLTVDLAKVTGALGLGLRLGERLHLDVVAARVFGADTEVAPEQAAIPRLNPLTGTEFPTESVNAGTYRAGANVLGIGLRHGW